jgi:hypothetical protein
MSQTMAGTLVEVLEEIGVRHIFGLIGDSMDPFAIAKSNGSASATRKGPRSRPQAKQSQIGRRLCSRTARPPWPHCDWIAGTRNIAEPALAALAAIDVEGNDDPVSLPELAMSRARLDHLAYKFVSEDVAALHRRHQVTHQVKVRTADRAARHLDDHISTILGLRIGDAVAANIVRPMPAERLHERVS